MKEAPYYEKHAPQKAQEGSQSEEGQREFAE